MESPAIRSAWSELEDVHTEVRRVRSRLLEIERRLARLEVRLELEGAEPPVARPPRPTRRPAKTPVIRRPTRAKTPFPPGPRTVG